MNETPAATPRVHAGCGHLCLTCGAQAAHRYMKAPASPTARGLTLSVLFFSAVFWCGMGFGLFFEWLGYPDAAPATTPPATTPPPDVQQRWSDGAPLQYVNTVDRSHYSFTLTADENGRASVYGIPGVTCFATAVEGPAYLVTAGQHMTVVGAEPGSVIHVGCW